MTQTTTQQPHFPPLLLLLLLLLSLLSTLLVGVCHGKACQEGSTNYSHYICIDQENDTDSGCCKSLLHALNGHHKSTRFYLKAGEPYMLNERPKQFNDTSDIALVGDGQNSTIVQCSNSNKQYIGLAFKNVRNVFIANITFINCGTNLFARDKDSEYTKRVYAAIHLFECRHFCMTHTAVIDSHNALGVSVHSPSGHNAIENSEFSNNKIQNNEYSGGGGVRIEFWNNYDEESELHVRECCFTNNTSNLKFTINTTDHTPRQLYTEKYLGSGGGLAIRVTGNTSRKSIHVVNCMFSKNKAISGGGLLALFQNNSTNNSVAVRGCIFEQNDSPYPNIIGAGGGGMRLDHNAGVNTIKIHDCDFSDNQATTGGGLSIVPALQIAPSLTDITVRNCTFERNRGHVGSAVEVTLLPFKTAGAHPGLVFKNLTLRNNAAKNKNTSPNDVIIFETGFAAMYINRMKVVFQDSITFEENNGSALGAVGTYLDFTQATNTTFINNHGLKGGAISLLGSVTILIDDATKMFFTDNTAEVFGGAIHNRYTEKDLLNYKKCFIYHKGYPTEPKHWSSTFAFVNNTARLQGDSIFTTSLYPCFYPHEDEPDKLSINDTFRSWGSWTFEPNDDNAIASDGGRVTAEMKTLEVFPGLLKSFSLSVFDDIGHNMSHLTVFMASVNDTTIATVDPRFTYISSNTIMILGKTNRTVKLKLSAISEREWHIHFQVHIQSCPLGHFSEETPDSVCQCKKKEQRFNEKLLCNSKEFQVYFESGHWVGWIEDKDNGAKKVLVAANCRINFCHVNLTEKYQQLGPNGSTCHDNRKGILCGECQEGSGPIVNGEDFDCQTCNGSRASSIAKYISTIYLPLTVVFCLIIFVNVRLTTGPANAFIFYAQIVSSTFDLYADGHIPLCKITHVTKFSHLKKAYLNPYRAPYGIFNLEFLENFINSVCLGQNLNTLDVLQLDYLVALYPLVLIIMCTICVKIKSYISKKNHPVIRSSLMHAFSAFLLCAYSKFALVSTYIVNTHPLYNENYIVIEKRVFLAGQFRSNDPSYVFRYYVPAVLVLIVCVGLPPVVLLGFPVRWFEKLCCRLPCCKKIYPSRKMKIFLNVFQGCYKDNKRFFASMYFFFRLFLYLSFILTNTGLQQYILQQIGCTVFILIIALCWPYKHNFQNYVDLFIFIDLAIVNAISLYLYTYFQRNPSAPQPVGYFAVQYILVMLPLLYMIGYIIWYFCKPSPEKVKECIDTSCFSPLLKAFTEMDSSSRSGTRRCRHYGSYQSLQSDMETPRCVTRSEVTLANAERSSPETEIEEILNRAEDGNTYKPLVPLRGSINGGDTVDKDSGLNTHSCSSHSSPPRRYGATDSDATLRTTNVEIHNYDVI